MVTIENDCFSISQICESGQCFRLDPVSENIYELIAADRYLEIEIQRGEDGREKTVFSCTQDQRHHIAPDLHVFCNGTFCFFHRFFYLIFGF